MLKQIREKRSVRSILVPTLAAILMFCALPATSADDPVYDIVIRNGRVLDGAGNPWVRADVAIKNGRFAKIGVVQGKGAREIDAGGQYVTPGWIDAMDQSASVLRENGRAENKLLMGVTTVVAGEGGTPVPADHIADYFKELETQGISPNMAIYYSVTQARSEIIGDVARKPTADELRAMQLKIHTAMKAGAIGVASALIYPPATFQSTDEIVTLVKAAAPYGGIYATHMRDEGRDLIKAIEEAIEIGERAGVPVEIFHLKAAYEPGWGSLMKEAGRTIEAARNRGVDVGANVYPYVAGGTGLDVSLPPEVFADGVEKAVERLKAPSYRAKLIERIEAKDFDAWSNLNVVAASGGWDNVVLANAHSEKYDKYRYRKIADIAAELGENPWELAWKIMLEGLPHRADAFYFMMSEEDVRTALQFPWTSIGSDAGAALHPGRSDDVDLPHPRSYGTFPRIIAEYVREHPVLSLPTAIRKMTSWPAMRLGLRDRGVIREGLWADVVVFDFETIEDKATWENGNAFPTGINYVLVNGRLVVDSGKHTGAFPGQVLRAIPAAAHAESPAVDAALQAQFARFEKISGGKLGVAALGLDRGGRIGFRSDEAFPMASTFKIAIACRVLDRVEHGEVRLDQMVDVPADKYVMSDIIADRMIHAGVSLSVANLVELMITESDNTATDVMVELAGGPQAVTDWLRRKGIEDQRIDRDTAGLLRDYVQLPEGNFTEFMKRKLAEDPGYFDEKEADFYAKFMQDPRDHSTPDAMVLLLEKLAKGRVLSQKNTDFLLDVMSRTRTGATRLKGLLPAGTKVAHKTGTIGGTANDVGIITLPDGSRAIVAVFVKGSTGPGEQMERAIAEVARTLYDYYLIAAN